MPSYRYQAYDKAGKEKSGSIVVDSEKQARKQLREQGLFLTDIKVSKSDQAESGKKKSFSSFSFGGRVSNFDLSLILRQVAILIRSGLPLEDSLALLIDQLDADKQRRLVQGWRAEIMEGRSLSSAMERSPQPLPEALIAGIGVGEETGHLDGIMERLAEELEVGAENRRTFIRGLTYPIMLVVASVVAMVVLMTLVVPQIAQVFVSARRDLPTITVIVIAMSDALKAYGLYAVFALIAAVVAFVAWCADTNRKRIWHRVMLKLPVAGKWMEMGNIADWARSLGTLLGSGVPALSALRISSSVMTNLHLRKQMEDVTEQMRRGTSLTNSLKAENVGSGFLHHMIGSGEASSELDKMLSRVAEYDSARLRSAVETFLKLMNPILIIFMGGIIVVIVIAVMLPIMQLSELTG